MGRVTQRVRAVRIEVSGPASHRLIERPDSVVVEAPMEIRVDGLPLTVTMRTPGDDFDLTIGFLLSEGLIAGADDVRRLMHCLDEDESGSPTYNVVDVTLAQGVTGPTESEARRFLTTSACGVCGTASIDAVRTTGRYAVESDEMRIDPALGAFAHPGGVHAAGLFTADGEVVVVREDIGRHNAVDKIVGWAAREGRLPLTGHVLVVSSRASFELTQKAFVAGIPVLAAVSAPSSLAIDLATEVGLTLVGFVRDPRLTVYSGRQRLGIPDGGRPAPHLGTSVSTTG